MDVDIKKLIHVVTIAQKRSFTRAAEELHITQPALSRSVAVLEQRFDVKLFERGRGSVVLTPVGKMVVAESEALIRLASALDHNIHLYSRGDAGNISFGMGPLIASLILPSLSSHFTNTRPNIFLRTSIKPDSILLNELMDDNIELFFCASSALEVSEEISIEPISTIAMEMIVRSGHPLAGRNDLKLVDIAAFPVAMSAGTELGPAGGFICDNYHILREMVLQSDSVWISSPHFVSDDLQSGRLAVITASDISQPYRAEVSIVNRKGRAPSPLANAVTAYVQESFSQLTTT